jgi:integrase
MVVCRAVLHAIFELAERRELREGNPVKRVKAPKAEERNWVILSAADYERLLGACAASPMLHLFSLVLGETGMRCESEALYLRWEDLDLEGGFVRVVSGRDQHRTKSGKSRDVPLSPRLLAAFREHFATFRFASYCGQRPLHIFHHETSAGSRTAGERVSSYRNTFNAAAKRAKLPAGFRQHDLRHSRATWWAAEGKSPVLIMQALGHSDLRVTMRYVHLAREHLRALVAETVLTDSPAATG